MKAEKSWDLRCARGTVAARRLTCWRLRKSWCLSWSPTAGRDPHPSSTQSCWRSPPPAPGTVSLSGLRSPSRDWRRPTPFTQLTDLNVNLVKENYTPRRLFDQHKPQRDPLPWRNVVGLNSNLMVKAILVCELEELRMEEMKEMATHGPGPLTADVKGVGCSGTHWASCLCQCVGSGLLPLGCPWDKRPLGGEGI